MFSVLVLGAQLVTILNIKAQLTCFLGVMCCFILHLTCSITGKRQLGCICITHRFVVLCPAFYAAEKKEELLVCLLLVAIMWSSALCHQLVLNIVLILTTGRAPGAVCPFECHDTPSHKFNCKLLCHHGSTLSRTIPLPCTHSYLLVPEHLLQVRIVLYLCGGHPLINWRTREQMSYRAFGKYFNYWKE